MRPLPWTRAAACPSAPTENGSGTTPAARPAGAATTRSTSPAAISGPITPWPRRSSAHSLLRAQKEVDPERIGVTGISWGGYLTSIIQSVDPRFKLAAPVYGCGFTTDHSFAKSVTGLGPERGARWMRWWDPSSYLKQAAIPILWVNGSNDFAYTLNAYQKSYRLPPGPRTLCIRLRMPHGHGPAGEGPKEIHVFADSILKGGVPLAKITGQGRDGRQVWATYESQRPIKKAELNFTRDLGPWPNRKWEANRPRPD